MPNDYRLEALGVAWWEEIGQTVDFDGTTYNVPLIRLRPDLFNDLRVTEIDDHTARIDYDQDQRP